MANTELERLTVFNSSVSDWSPISSDHVYCVLARKIEQISNCMKQNMMKRYWDKKHVKNRT
jgi:hypothetical protein